MAKVITFPEKTSGSMASEKKKAAETKMNDNQFRSLADTHPLIRAIKAPNTGMSTADKISISFFMSIAFIIMQDSHQGKK